MQLNRGTISLLIISLVVVIAVGLFQQPLLSVLTPPTPTIEVKQILPFRIAQEAIKLTISRDSNFTTLERPDDVWQVTDATNLDDARITNDEMVDGILQLMAELEYMRKFESDDLAQFGLADSVTSIEIVTPEQQLRLTLGGTNPDRNNLYISVNDDNTVYLVPAVFEFSNIMRLATTPPYRDIVEADDNLPDNLLFPDVFGYQIMEFRIRDMRDGSVVIYQQGEQGTWILDGTVVNTEIEIDHVQAAVNVSQFLFLEIEPLESSVRESLTNLAILTLSMTTDDGRAYTMAVHAVDDRGYAGILDDGTTQKAYALPIGTVNSFFDMIIQPPYLTS